MKIVEDTVVQETLEWAKGELEALNKRKRKLSVKSALVKEYLRTFINNPTAGNYVLMSCGRADEMKRKEETQPKLIKCSHCGGMFEVLYKSSNFVCAHCYIGFGNMPEVKWAKDETEAQDDK